MCNQVFEAKKIPSATNYILLIEQLVPVFFIKVGVIRNVSISPILVFIMKNRDVSNSAQELLKLDENHVNIALEIFL